MVAPIGEADLVEQGVGALPRRSRTEPCRPERDLDILGGGEARDEVERLEHDSYPVPAVLGECRTRE
jgi:hypothetical protein